MGGTRELRLGHVFTGWDALAEADRRRLAELVAVAGRPPPLLAGELAMALLPADPEGLEGVRQVVREGVCPSALAALGEMRVAELIPAISRCDVPVSASPCPARLRGILGRAGVATWAELGRLRLAEVQTWHDLGPAQLATLVHLAVDAGLSLLVDALGSAAGEPAGLAPGDPPAHTAAPATAGDLALLLDHEQRGDGAALRRALTDLSTSAHPRRVQAAARRLLHGQAGAANPCLASLTRLLAAAGDTRDRLVFERGTLALDPHASNGDMRAALGVSTERLRQLRQRAAGRVHDVLQQLGPQVHPAAGEVARRLGGAASLQEVDEALAAAALPKLPDTRSLLLLHLAGPYRVVAGHAGWVATDPAQLLAETRRLLAEDGGVRPLDHAVKELEVFGVEATVATLWLSHQSACLVDDLIVSTSGSVLDVAERLLSALGRPASVEELSELAGEALAGAEADLWRSLGRDARFAPVGGAFELAEWGTSDDGDASAPWAGGFQLPPAGDDRIWWSVEVDADLLAGEEAALDESLILRLGIRAGGRRTYPSRYGPVEMANERGPARGPLRHVALAAGATLGDQLLFGFGADGGDTVVERRRPTPAAVLADHPEPEHADHPEPEHASHG